MSYVLYGREDCNVAMERESTRRSGAVTEANAIPFDIFDELEIPDPLKEWEELFPVHSGRNVGNIGDKTYPAAEGSLEMRWQTGILLYYILGACTTTEGTPNVHAITEANDLPSFKLHFEQLNSGGGDDIVKDLIGCFATELTMSFAKDDLATLALSFIVPKSITGTKFTTTTWSSFNFTNKIFNWDHPTFSTFTFDTVNVISTWGNIPIETLSITIRNEIELLSNLGDPHLDEPKIGKREYEIKMLIYPKDDLFLLCRDKHPEDYTGALTIKVARNDTSDYVEFTFSDLYVADYPNKIPNVDDKAVGVEITLRNSPGGTLAIEVKDDKDKDHYEGT